VDDLVREHIQWALHAQLSRLSAVQALPQQAQRQTQRLVRIITKGLPRDA
ncbi:MAG: tRNA epoxyqueuosine(34) reductase QueG, partial [Shewanella sp.]